MPRITLLVFFYVFVVGGNSASFESDSRIINKNTSSRLLVKTEDNIIQEHNNVNASPISFNLYDYNTGLIKMVKPVVFKKIQPQVEKPKNIKTINQVSKTNNNKNLNNNGEKIVALCFDDGPHKGTEKLLDILDEYKIKATFFIVGRNITRFKKSFDRIVASNHEIANHTYDHVNMVDISIEKALENINKCKNEIEKYYSGPVRFFRPPYFSTTKKYNEAIKEKFGYIVTIGTSCGDWGTKTTVKTVYNNAVKLEFNNKFVLVLHCDEDQEGNKIYLREILSKYIKDGYKFVTMSEFYGLK